MSTRKNQYSNNIRHADAKMKFGEITDDKEITAAEVRSGCVDDN